MTWSVWVTYTLCIWFQSLLVFDTNKHRIIMIPDNPRQAHPPPSELSRAGAVVTRVGVLHRLPIQPRGGVALVNVLLPTAVKLCNKR